MSQILKDKNYLRFTAIGLAVLILVSVFSLWSGEKYRESTGWRDHSAEVLTRINELQTALARAESAQRAYLFTNRPYFLDEYNNEKKFIAKSPQVFADLVDHHPQLSDLARNLQDLITERIAGLDYATIPSKGNGTPETAHAFRQGNDPLLTREILTSFNEIIQSESELHAKRAAEAEHEFFIARYLVFFGLVFSFALLLTVTVFLRSEMRRRARVEKFLVQAEAKANEASAMKSQFLANMSHEIRTPLNGIIGMGKLLSGTELNSDQKSYLDTILDSSNSLLTLINGILDLSKIESGKLQLEETHFELRSLVQSARSILDFSAMAKGLEIAVEVDNNVPDHFIGDPLRVRQILINLINNAIKFSSAGRIHLKVSMLDESNSISRLFFEVTDQGIGMNEQTKEKLFQSFSQGDESTTRRFGGTGLGLAITKQLVEMMDGKINVESTPDKGSRFFFDLTLKASKYDHSEKHDQADEASEQFDGYILVAEDNLTNQKVAAAMLKTMGCRYKIVSNGFEAIKALQEECFDIVLMDGQMPDLDGYEATRRIRKGEASERNRKIPIIAVTANAIKGDLETCLEAGMNDYVSKPISQKDLSLKVSKWLKDGMSALDTEAIKRLNNLDPDGSQGLVRQIIQIFLESAPDAIVKMRKALKAEDIGELNQLAHSLKSTCANMGARRMRELASRIEKCTAATEKTVITNLINALENELATVSEELRKNDAA